MEFAKYESYISNLKVNRKGKWVAPHKAVLLLSVIDCIERGEINSVFIPINDTLQRRFKRIWETYVSIDIPYICNMAYPFFHMNGEPFWRLIPRDKSVVVRKEYASIGVLKKDFDGAVIDRAFYEVLQVAENRNRLANLLIAQYLSCHSSNLMVAEE